MALPSDDGKPVTLSIDRGTVALGEVRGIKWVVHLRTSGKHKQPSCCSPIVFQNPSIGFVGLQDGRKDLRSFTQLNEVTMKPQGKIEA